MIIIRTLLFLAICHPASTSTYRSPSQNISFSLGDNLITNGNVSQPSLLPARTLRTFTRQINGWRTKRRFVEYLTGMIKSSNLCRIFKGMQPQWQFLDTDSSNCNEQYFQQFNLTAGKEYQLRFDWISQISFSLLSAGIQIYWNENLIDSFYDNSCQMMTSTYYFFSISGINQIVFAGMGRQDSFGIMIRNITLQEIIYNRAQTTFDNTTLTDNVANTTLTDNVTNTTLTDNVTNTTLTDNLTNTTLTDNVANKTLTDNLTNTTLKDNVTNTAQAINLANTTQPNSSNNSAYPVTQKYLYFRSLHTFYSNKEFTEIFDIYCYIQEFQLAKLALRFPFLKQNIKFIFGYMLQLNHFILYNYHNRNYTTMALIILQGIKTLDDQKAFILDSFILPLMGQTPESIMQQLSQRNLQIKMKKIMPIYITRPTSIALQFLVFLGLELPMTLLLFSAAAIICKIFPTYRICQLLQQYSVLAFFFYVLLNGKVELLTFHFLQQLVTMSSYNFKQRIALNTIIFLYFIVLFFAIAAIFLFKAWYGRKIKYLDCNSKQSKKLIFVTVSLGIYNILLGFAHRILIQAPLAQLYVLICIQVMYLAYLLWFLFQGCFKDRFLGFVLCSMNGARLVFAITHIPINPFFVSDNFISDLQKYLFFSCILLCIISSLLYSKNMLLGIFYLFKRKNKVMPQILFCQRETIMIEQIKATPKAEKNQQNKIIFTQLSSNEISSRKNLFELRK